MLKKYMTSFLLKKSTANDNCLKPFDRVLFTKDVSHSQFELFLDYTKYYCNDILWDNIQRDIILNLVNNFYVVVHLDGYQTKISMTELDPKIGEYYSCKEYRNNEYFIEIMPHDLRLLTLLKNDSILWECGNVLEIAAFHDLKQVSTSDAIFENAEFVFHSINDNHGFDIYVSDMKRYGAELEIKIQCVLDNYHIMVEGDS